jgi:hypothetical protein
MKIKFLCLPLAGIVLALTSSCENQLSPAIKSEAISIVSVTITAPSANQPPDTEASGGGNFTVASVSWTPDDHTFMVYKVYTVSISLKAMDGYFFANNLSAAINGQTASVSGGGAVTLSYTFAEIPDSANIGMDGTPGKPFKVYDVATLKRVGTEPTGGWSLIADYEQTADIVLPPVPAGESNWTAIGSYGNSDANSFRGIYDGGGHTISNLTINAAADNQGMFGYLVNNSTVKNIGIINGNVRGRDNIGGVTGLNNGGTIQNCYFSGSVTGGNDTGGIVGENNGTVQNCYSTGNVSGGAGTAGGVAGSNSRTVQNCAALNYSVITSHNSSAVGRIVGEHNSGTLANNYAHSDMILKHNWANNEGIDKTPISNSGGVDGANISAAQYNSEDWWKNTSNWKTDGAFAWDFDAVWEWDSAAGLPVLRK